MSSTTKLYSQKKPFFSVVIPTYNQSSLLRKAIQSVLNQTFNNYEIIIIDNYSEDNTEKIVNDFNSDKIKYIKNHNHGLLAKSRNIGINESKSEWIAFLDSDDSWTSNRLEILFNFLSNDDSYPVVCTNELVVDKIKNKKKVWKYGPYNNSFYKTLLKYGNRISTSAAIVKKIFLDENKIYFDENKDFAPTEDYDFWMRLAKKEARFKFLNYVLGEHLFHEESWGSKNKLLCKKSTSSILKYHVFNVQDFTKNKKKLWESIESRLIIDEVVDLFISNYRFKAIFMMLKLIYRHPFLSLIQIFFKLKRKF